MARQKGLLKIDGTIGGMTFYRTQDGMIVKEQLPSTKNKFETDASYQRTRENAQEFGMAATSGKMLRDSIRSFIASAADSRVTARLTQIMSYILKEDTTSARGQRSVAKGLATVNGKAFLRNFNFNNNAILGSVVFKQINLDKATGDMTLTNLNPINEIEYPQGATHVTLKNAFMTIDFTTGQAFVVYSGDYNLSLNAPAADLLIETNTVPTIKPGMNSIYLIAVEFFQEVNGVQYSLKNGAYNCLEIVDVD
ncbi:hypothetical protein [Cytophaga aurantiaca]|uniref:hypothetical protein n=1 Tax=Cytophaga aurantiaca TaxID=29530 RepID=UPI00035DC6F4|nr:hypothetical protein [Cytophaga aurantiaca]